MLSHVWLFVTPWILVRQAPPSMELPRQELLEWVDISSSRGTSLPKDWIQVSCLSCIGRWILSHLSYQGNPLKILFILLSIVRLLEEVSWALWRSFICISHFYLTHFFKTPRGNGYVTDSLWLSEEVLKGHDSQFTRGFGSFSSQRLSWDCSFWALLP